MILHQPQRNQAGKARALIRTRFTNIFSKQTSDHFKQQFPTVKTVGKSDYDLTHHYFLNPSFSINARYP